ncbi:MAG: Gfo/Idh/MocA family oxidoreductase [Streptosporangiales bacterium]
MSENLLRVGLLGAGRIGSEHARRLHERVSGARLVAVVDPDVDRASAVIAGIPGARAEADPFAVLTASDVDAAVIAAPGPLHEPLLLPAIERGLPVLCEKPLAPDPQGALRVLKAEEAAGRRLVQVGFNRRFDAEYRALKQSLDAGELGRPLLMHCVHRNPSSPPGFTDGMLISDSVVHELDATRWLLGDEIAAVSVRRPRATSNAPEGLHDPQVVSLESAGGALVDVEIFVNCLFGYQVRCEVVCERGTVTIGGETGPVVHAGGRWGGTITPGFPERFGRAFDAEFQAWVDAARQGRVDGADAWDGYAAATICDAGVRAQETGGRVPVEMVERPALYS